MWREILEVSRSSEGVSDWIRESKMWFQSLEVLLLSPLIVSVRPMVVVEPDGGVTGERPLVELEGVRVTSSEGDSDEVDRFLYV